MRLTAAALAAFALAAGSVSASTTSAPSRVQVTAKEFYFVVSRHTVKAGPAIVELVNYGEDPHDLLLQRVGARHIAGTPEVQPGDFYDLNVKLLPGRYKLWCSIANHRQLGMQAVLTVVAATSR